MLIVIITIVLLLIGILGLIGYNNDWFDIRYTFDFVEFASILLILLFGVALAVEIPIVLIEQIPAKKNYEKFLIEKEMLEYRLENDNLGIGNELLYKDIVEFNQELKDVKYYANNPWTNWFANGYIAEIDYIELEGK